MLKGLPYKNIALASLATTFVTALVIVIARNILPPVAPLYYGLPVGVSQLVPSMGLLIAPGVSLLINVINISLANITKDQFYKKTLIVSGAFVSALTAITVLKIIALVGFY